MREKNVFWAIALLFVLNSCSDKVQQTAEAESQQFVRFNASIEGVYTRAAGSAWSAGDAIGIYMKKNGAELTPGSIISNGDNVEYSTLNGDGRFLPHSTYLNFPQDGSKVDFIAYYPHQETINNFIYSVNVNNQAVPEAIDLLYADGLVGISERSNALQLSFSHQLSRLVFNVKSLDGKSLNDLKISIAGVKTEAEFKLANGELQINNESKGTVAMHMVKGEGLVAEAILLPEGSVSGVKLIIEQGSNRHEQALANLVLEKGKVYTHTVNIKNSASSVDPEATTYAKWRETPVITKSQLESPTLKYVNHDMPNAMKDPVSKKTLRNYSMLYDTNLKFAYWVAYPLFSAAVGSSGRTDDWGYDPSISPSLQANLSSGFGSGSGYDRGHQLPSGDRTCDKATNQTTFYYSNMTPQVGQKMNQSIWADLENKVRSWMSGTDTLFVVTGAMPPASGTIERQKGMAVPAYYFKALARQIGGTFYTIAFKMDNKSYSDRNYMNTALSVEELEQTTGFTFFPTLDSQAKKLDKTKWQ